MASTIKVDNIQDQCGSAVVTKCGASKTLTVTTAKANNYQAADGGNLINQCGTTITLGASGDTITLACGASQTGFGRTGTVDWDTTAKTASFTAVSGNGYFVNTTSAAVTMTLPATPSAGDIVSVADYANTFATNNLTIANNGSPINGVPDNYTADTAGISLTFVYVDGTRGWKNVNDGTTDATGLSDFIVATGGTVTTCGDYKIHTFTGPGTFTVSQAGNPCGSTTVDYLVVAGGGGGANSNGGGGGGGAGGYRESSGAASGCYSASPLGSGVSALPVSVTGYPVTVGAGGTGGKYDTPPATAGSNSIFSTITSAGGGLAAEGDCSPGPQNGGSGGGGSYNSPGGTGNTPPVSPPQGNNGGNGNGTAPIYGGGGGGGASAAGTNGSSTVRGNGGAGTTSSINATPIGRAGGGGGGGFAPSPGGSASDGGGAGGGGAPGTVGTINTGGGGGGAGSAGADPGATGGSGIVIIRYKYQ